VNVCVQVVLGIPPAQPIYEVSSFLPHWTEIVLLFFQAGVLVSELSSFGGRSGLGFVSPYLFPMVLFRFEHFREDLAKQICFRVIVRAAERRPVFEAARAQSARAGQTKFLESGVHNMQ
jgi:hypothetical protein